MKVGDSVFVKVEGKKRKGKIIRFYANHGTALVQVDGIERLTYYSYNNLIEKNKKNKTSAT